MVILDKRELYKTAKVKFDTKIFKAGEYVAVHVLHRMAGPWVFDCRGADGRKDQISEGFLEDFVL